MLNESDFARQQFSWEGEDVLLAKIFADYLGVFKGFYVDVGAHHPLGLSNTHFLYRLGWHGINIDATPGSMEIFKEIRPKDINIECGVSKVPSTLRFAIFEDSHLNGFLPDKIVEKHIKRGCKFIGYADIKTEPLREILLRAEAPEVIDLMNIDVEGLEIEVLESNDFTRWRPKAIVAEIVGCSDIRSVLKSDICRYIESLGYKLFSRLHFSSIFIDAPYVR